MTAVLVGLSVLPSNTAQAWHRHFLGAYGVNFYNPAAYVYAGPRFYSSYTWASYPYAYRPFHHWHSFRPLHYWHRPYVAYRPIVTSLYVSPIYYTPPVVHYTPPVTYYTAPITTCSPIIYTQPAASFSDDGCTTCSSNTAPSIDSSVDPQLQIQYQARPTYSVAKDAEWLNIAITMIDDMVSSGGYAEAELACEQLIAVREHVPASVYLRAGLLSLRNGKSISDAARYFHVAQQEIASKSTSDVLSSQFIDAMKLKDFDAIEADVQNASKLLLATGRDTPKVRLTSETSTTVTVLKPTAVNFNSDAAVVLQTLLEVNGQKAKANEIRAALDRLPSL